MSEQSLILAEPLLLHAGPCRVRRREKVIVLLSVFLGLSFLVLLCMLPQSGQELKIEDALHTPRGSASSG